MSKSILKPAAAASSVSFRVPADLAARLAAVRAASQPLGLVLDIEPALTKALSRLVKQAEAELIVSAPPEAAGPDPVAVSSAPVLESVALEVQHV
jgi:hypothetical protein